MTDNTRRMRQSVTGLMLIVGLMALLVLALFTGTPVAAQDDLEDYEELRIDAPELLPHNETANVSVERVYYDTEAERNVTEDVTDEVNIYSEDTSVISVDGNTLTATPDGDVAERVNVTAVLGAIGPQTETEVTVATTEIRNLSVLPPWWRLNALIGDTVVQVLVISMFAAIAATRLATSFAGIGAMQLVVTIGWFGGYVPTGIALVGLFTALFIGFNLAANIDYTVHR